MAMIEKIRKQSWLLLTMIGLGLLSFLVPYDAVMSMFGNTNSSIGEIDGHAINAQEWHTALEEREPLFRYDGNQQNLSNDTWNQLLENGMYQDEFDALGLTVSDEEYDEITFGDDLSSFVLTTVYGGKDSTALKEQMRKNFDGMDTKMSSGWKKLVIQKRQKEKYDAMVAKGLYANSLDAKWAFKMQNDKVSVDYVVKTYAEIPDSTITWTDSDIRSYFNKHKNDREYKQETSRSIEYIKFPVRASSEDSTSLKATLAGMVPVFVSSKNDSTYAANNASTPGLTSVKYKNGDVVEPYNTQFMNDSVGSVVGPYADGPFMKIAKITKRGMEVDSVQARHILIKEKTPAGKAKADSIRNVIVKERNFEAMAAMYGTDGTKDKGGDLGMYGRGAMVKPFEDATFSSNVGDVKVIETSFGYHVIEVTKKKEPSLVTTIAVVDKSLAPSQRTIKSAYQLAKEFTLNYGDTATFRNAADTLNGGTVITPAKNIKPNATSVSGLAEAGEVISWAYSAELGEVSQPMRVGDEYVIAALTEVKEKGVPTLENVYDKVKDEVIKEKKAEMYVSQMKEGTLADIAARIKVEVKKGENITMKSNNIPGSGVSGLENELIGVCFGLKTGFMSSPIVGKGGIYVVQRNADIAPGTSADNYLADQDRLNNTWQQRASNAVFNAYKESANVEDNRYERR